MDLCINTMVLMQRSIAEQSMQVLCRYLVASMTACFSAQKLQIIVFFSETVYALSHYRERVHNNHLIRSNRLSHFPLLLHHLYYQLHRKDYMYFCIPYCVVFTLCFVFFIVLLQAFITMILLY